MNNTHTPPHPPMSDSLDCTSTISVDAETCSAILVVDLDGNRLIDQPYVRCFDAV